MKGISAVIGALIVLIITIALGGLAYTVITGTATRQIAGVISVDPSLTSCSGTSISVGVKNDGTDAITWSSISVSGTNSAGGALGNPGACTTAGSISAGTSGSCGRTLTGTAGTNKITVISGRATATGIATCVG